METLEQKVERLRDQTKWWRTAIKESEDALAAAEAELAREREATRTVGRTIAAKYATHEAMTWIAADINAALAVARAEEREACAAIADTFESGTSIFRQVERDARHGIAAAIRAGRSPC